MTLNIEPQVNMCEVMGIYPEISRYITISQFKIKSVNTLCHILIHAVLHFI